MKIKSLFIFAVVLISPLVICAQEQTDDVLLEVVSGEHAKSDFETASESIHQKLQNSVSELNRLREQVANEKVPLSRKLSDLESKLVEVRLEYQKTTRLLDSRTLDLSNLRSEIKSRQQEATYLSNLLGEYIRNFESRLHIAEIQRYRKSLEKAKLAPENSNLSEQEIYQAQAGLLDVSLDRIEDALGGTRFDGTATDSTGSIHHGTFVLIGPAAFFQSDDGKNIGTAEQRLGSLEPTVIEFGNLVDADAASKVIANSEGLLPFDPTLGNAHKIEETKETILGHIKKGGVVMYPIFALAGAALLVALFKWIGLFFIRKPSRKKINALLDAVSEHNESAIGERIKTIKGPVGRMLAAGVEHIKEPRELIEEVMYEKVLATRLKLERFLPFIAISAASAPLLGLLGTVTGIINTFKLITVFGSGDVKTLSGGISEALITTEFGLIVAIPSLLLHAFLSRKAKGVINEMEKAAVAFINQVSKTPYHQNDMSDIISKLTPSQTQNLLKNIGSQPQAIKSKASREYPEDCAAALMNDRLLMVDGTITVAKAIDKIRAAETSDDIDAVFVVDEKGKYTGNVLIRQLLTRPEHVSVESLADTKSIFVRVDTHKDQVHNLFSKHDIANMPVLDYEDRLVGQVSRNGNGDGK